MRKILLIPLTVFILLPIVTAFQYDETCINDTHLQKVAIIRRCSGTSCSVYNFTQVQNCTNNCSGNKCIGTDITTGYSVPLIVGSGIGTAFFFYIAVAFKERYSLLQPLFMFVGMLMMLNTFGIARSIAETGGASADTMSLINTSIMVTSWVLYITFFYFMVMLLVTVLGAVLPKSKFGSKWKKRKIG